MPPILIFFIAFLAIFTQTVAGFGLALVSMPLLLLQLDSLHAAPLVSLIAITAEVVLLTRYRHAFNLRVVWRLSAASLLGVPLGVWIVVQASGPETERLVLAALGIVVVGYALYALLNLRLPAIADNRWAYGFGFVAGVLSGAYNISGPAVVIYGSCRGWPPAEFKSNLQGFFLINSATVILAHLTSGHFTTPVLESYLAALPGILLGLAGGFLLERYINAARFRRLVLILLVVLGLSLLL